MLGKWYEQNLEFIRSFLNLKVFSCFFVSYANDLSKSGDPAVQEFDGSHMVFVGAGSDPFDVITNAVK